MGIEKFRRRVSSAENRVALSQFYPGSFGVHFASQEKFLMAAPTDCIIDEIVIVSDTGHTKAGSNQIAFHAYNLTDSNYITGTGAVSTITADTAYELTIGTANNSISQDDVIELQVEPQGSASNLSAAEIIAQVHYRPV